MSRAVNFSFLAGGVAGSLVLIVPVGELNAVVP